MIETDPVKFNEQIRLLTTPAACAGLFRESIAAFGFDTFACGEVDLAIRERTVFYLIDWPEPWRRFYIESGLIEHDPLVEALATRHQPFTWSDLRKDRQFAVAGTAAINLANELGWTEGLVVPFPRSKTRIGLVSLVGRRTIDQTTASYLALISTCLFAHVRALIAKTGFALPPAGLTEREISCIQLVARGLSDAAIGESLGVASSTAHEFVEKAKKRLRVRSRAELTAVAVSLGIIDI